MKAIRHCEYGGPEVLKLEERRKAGSDMTTKFWSEFARLPSTHSTCTIRRLASPPPVALACANQKTLDWVSTMPERLKRLARTSREFKPGDEVFGGKNGAFAEYICVRRIERWC